MRRIRVQRSFRQLIIDGLFIALLAHFAVTGSLVPNVLVELLRDDSHVSVSSEPVKAAPLDAGPVLDEPADPQPET